MNSEHLEKILLFQCKHQNRSVYAARFLLKKAGNNDANLCAVIAGFNTTIQNFLPTRNASYTKGINKNHNFPYLIVDHFTNSFGITVIS